MKSNGKDDTVAFQFFYPVYNLQIQHTIYSNKSNAYTVNLKLSPYS